LADNFQLASGCGASSPSTKKHSRPRPGSKCWTCQISASTSVEAVWASSLAPGDTLPDYRVYVHSVRFSHQDVAALLAALWKAQQALKLAERG
jgi:hypothetical protein